MKYFTIEELCQSETADKHKIGNHPTADVRAALVDLINNVLDPAREALGMPITVNSGFRSPILNSLVGGSKNSQHMRGEAADITCSDNARLFAFIRDNLEFDQLIDEHDLSWVHVSYKREGNRKQVLKIG